MSYAPTVLDVKTDLRRSVMASFSARKFADPNVKIFLLKAENNLKTIGMSDKKYKLILERLKKARDSRRSVENRREDLLTASVLI
jgi:hypothetical protein